MLDFDKAMPQVEAMADKIALDAAAQSRIPADWWTDETVRQHNRRWLRRHAPELLDRLAHADEPATCAAEGCGGPCILAGWDPAGERLAHACQRCGEAWAVPLAVYESLDLSN